MILFSSMIWEWYNEHLVLQWNYKHLTFLTKELIVMSTKFKCSHTSSNIVPIHKWSDIWPSFLTHTQNLCSAFHPSKCTHTQQWTHTRSCGQAMLWPPGSSWGFGALLKGLTSVVVLRVEEWWIFTPPLTIPETQYPRPLGYESDSLSIRLPSFSTTFFLKLCQHTY